MRSPVIGQAGKSRKRTVTDDSDSDHEHEVKVETNINQGKHNNNIMRVYKMLRVMLFIHHQAAVLKISI
jgi:hypothetical protein